MPDSDPMDLNGHGTHVAGIVGAQAASQTGVTGVAPGVEFVALKVFGPTGSTPDYVVVQALEMAYALNVDVVNMSLGSAFAWPGEPSAQASQWLTDRGVVVVASGGNEGESGEFATGSPAVGTGAIAVASFENSMATRTGFIDPEGAPMGYGTMSFSPEPPASGQSAEIVFAGLGTSDADFLNPDGTSKVAGKVALISRGAISFYEKSERARAHGAVQVIIHNNQPGFFAGTLGQPGAYVPTMGISGADGLRLRSLMEAGPVHLTWTGQTYQFVNETAGQISGFSSWGPSPDLAMKPDLTAPGGSIYSTYPLADGGYASLSGTSMAAPHVAGAAALLLQAKAGELSQMGPKKKTETVRAMLMNTATPRTAGSGGSLYPVHRQGAGMIDVNRAINAPVRAVPDKLSLGELQGTNTAVHQVQISNTSSTEQFYSFTVVADGVSLAAQPQMLRLRPGQSRQVRFTLTVGDNQPAGLFYGWIHVQNSAGESIASIPFLGFKDDYQAATTLDPLAYDLPWLAYLDEEGYLNPTEAMTINPDCGCVADAAYVVFSLARQAEELKLEIIQEGSNKHWGNAYRADFAARSAGEVEILAWNGTTDRGRPVPDGTYRLQLKALRPLGDKQNPDHWDIWISGPITID